MRLPKAFQWEPHRSLGVPIADLERRGMYDGADSHTGRCLRNTRRYPRGRHARQDVKRDLISEK
jgi:hypothetical protein